MGVTLRHIVDDLAKDFKQIFDDKDITKSQIAFWVINIGNRLKSQHIAKRDSGAFLSIFSKLPVEMYNSTTNPNQVENRKYILLPRNIYDYNMDGGIEYMSYFIEDQKPGCPPPFTKTLIQRTTPSDSQRLYYSKYEQPSPKNPYFYRVGDHLYLLGLECVDVEFIEIGIYATLLPITDVDFDAPFDFPEELIPILTRQVLDLGRFVMMIPEDRVNDGSDTSKEGGQIPTNKLVSVNELNEDQPNNQ